MCNILRVRVTLWLMVSHSVCLGVEPHLGLMTTYLLTVWQLQTCPIQAPCLSRGQVCLVSHNLTPCLSRGQVCLVSHNLSLCQYVHTHIYIYLKFFMFDMCYKYNMYKPFVSPGSVHQIKPYWLWPNPPRQSRHLNGRTHDRATVSYMLNTVTWSSGVLSLLGNRK
jgi:hypothetical protein